MSSKKLISICAAGLILNLIGYAFAHFLGLPFYLDTSGMMVIAALGGYVPGITLAFLTKVILSFVESSEMYHCWVMILIAIFIAYFARKGYYDSLKGALKLILPLTLMACACDLLIDSFLSAADGERVARIFDWSFTDNFLRELLDKGSMTLLTFAILKFIPPHIKEAFRHWGKKQAPLSEEMQKNMQGKDYFSSSLRNKLLVILIGSSLFVSFSIALISFLLFRDALIGDRVRTAESLVTMAANEINPDRVDDYINLGREATGYRSTEERLLKIRNINRAIEYLYVYKIEEDGCHVVFDLSTADVEASSPGEVIAFDADFYNHVPDLLAGKPIAPIVSHGQFGYLLTVYKPVYNSVGQCVCYVGMDYSMKFFVEYTRNFVIKLLALFVSCFIVIFAIGFVFIENHITLPVNTMAYCSRNASYDNAEERPKHVARIKGLQIKTGDEIENLYTALVQSAENISTYLEHLQVAKMEVTNMRVKVFAMDELAHTDSLTGVRNKTAYVGMTNKLDIKIADGTAEFCIAMIDVNFLKRVNDTYGHERGNEYLINACKLICSVFGEEHVYRIGGDEFVVIIEGDKVSLGRYFVMQIRGEMNRKKANALLNPWEQVSAAIGFAVYDPNIDKSADDVFKRADKLMYENKIAMKAQRTD